MQSRANIAKIDKLIHENENIVVGSSLTAALFAFENKYPLYFTNAERPFRFDHLEVGQDFDNLKIPSSIKVVKSFDGQQTLGIPKHILWERVMFLLSLDSKTPLSNLCSTIRNNGDSISCFNDYSKICEIKYETCYYFGDTNASGFVRKKGLAESKFMCYDWIAFNRGGKHEIDYIKTNDKFVNEVWFYSSDRIDGNTAVKDACVVSELSESEMLDFDYSETMARFKLIHTMESNGMKGKFNGYGQNGKPKYYKFRTSSIARTKRQCADKQKPESKNIKIPSISEKDLLQSLQHAKLGSDLFLRWL